MVEIKFTFTGANLQKARTLGQLTEPTMVRTAAFFDTRERGLLDGALLDSKLSLILRVRFNPQNDRGSTTVKVRAAGTLDPSLKTDEAADAKREVDLAFGKPPLDSYSLGGKQDRDEIEAVLAGHRPVKSIFSNAQEACIDRLASKRFPWADLRIFGPVEQVEAWEEVSIAGLPRSVTFELWRLPGMGDRPARQILELSTRAPDEEAPALASDMQRVLTQHGIDPSASDTKTKTVLEHLSPGRKAK